jgi:hypothetical protein
MRALDLLAIWADSEEFEAVGDAFETGLARDALFEIGREAVGDLDDFCAGLADQMVMVIFLAADKFEARGSVAEIEAMDHAHFFEEMHGAINCGEIAFAFGQGGKDFFAGERVLVMAENVKDGLARAGDFAGFAAETRG